MTPCRFVLPEYETLLPLEINGYFGSATLAEPGFAYMQLSINSAHLLSDS